MLVKRVPPSFFFQNHDGKLSSVVTGELFHPVRLYYRLFNKNKVKEIFKKTKCMKFDDTYDRWAWLYQNEAKNIKLPKKYSELPSNIHPLVIGSFFSRTDDEMFLDVRSIERAEQAAVFFDELIERSIAEFTDIAITNRFVQAKDRKEFFNFDFLFESKDVVIKSEEEISNMTRELERIGDINERRNVALNMILNKLENEEYPDIERFQPHFYEDGIELLSLKLKHCQNIALERFNGNESYKPIDTFKRLLKGFGQTDEFK